MAEEELVCPNCHSPNVQKYEVAFMNGTSVTDSTTVGAGLAGSLGIGGAKTKSTTQSNMAAVTTPPAKLSYVKPFIVYLLLSWLVLGSLGGIVFKGTMLEAPMKVLLVVVIFGIAGYKVYRNYKWNAEMWPQLMEQWHHSYVCLKCGNHFLA